MLTSIIYQMNGQDFAEAIEAQLGKLNQETFLNRFEGRYVTINAVAEIHGVHRDTVARHLQAGNIKAVKKGDKALFELSEVLTMKFTELRKKTRL